MTFHACPHVIAIEQRLRQFTRTRVSFVAGALTQSGSEYQPERQLMTRASEKRQREFYSGRHLARLAMAQAGVPPTALLRGKLGNPLWPAGFLGSITHDHSLGAAVVCRKNGIHGIGLDLIEDPNQVTDDLAQQIMHPNEAVLLEVLYPDLRPAAIAFSVKESVVKAVSVLLGRYMDLLEIHLTHQNDTLYATVDGLPDRLPCLMLISEIGLITSSVYIANTPHNAR
ncbi:MAG: 4'-phosphopantetheinyl transferase family protein [Pseudomonadota bacterium]